MNQSRVFTLGGGNILIWSDEGSIDAGNGSKSSLSVPPPLVQVNLDGSITVNYGGSLEGSGIRTIQTNPTTPPGDVDLDAPVGTVNAGDAGIGAAGNINIAAAHVIGVSNINFGGTATGVPSDVSSLGASLSGVSAVASSTTSSATTQVAEANAAKETAPLAQSALNFLDVFVTGLGEENCKPDDIECLKRQKTASP
ncbi:MAG: filamentous hemagglutinin family protein [Steroidobacteraceae bacterium]